VFPGPDGYFGAVAKAENGSPASAGMLFAPMLTTDEGGHGALGRVGGRLMAAHGVDAGKTEEGDIRARPPFVVHAS